MTTCNASDRITDVLDEFDSKPKLPAEPKPAASGPGRPPASSSSTAEAVKKDTAVKGAAPSEEDFAAQLQAGMNSLISELDENPDMKKQFEDMMQELISAGQAPTDAQAAEHIKKAGEAVPTDADEKARAGKGQDKFQDTIRKTMERMQQSDTAASTSATSAAGKSEEEMLMEMLKGLGTGEGGEEDFNSMLLNMMTQLTNKEILYEPMKELNDKFPAWMEKNKASTSAADLERYQEQERLVREIVGRFERKGYSDDNADDREYIVERMQKVTSRVPKPIPPSVLTKCDRCKLLARRRQILLAT